MAGRVGREGRVLDLDVAAAPPGTKRVQLRRRVVRAARACAVRERVRFRTVHAWARQIYTLNVHCSKQSVSLVLMQSATAYNFCRTNFEYCKLFEMCFSFYVFRVFVRSPQGKTLTVDCIVQWKYRWCFIWAPGFSHQGAPCVPMKPKFPVRQFPRRMRPYRACSISITWSAASHDGWKRASVQYSRISAAT